MIEPSTITHPPRLGFLGVGWIGRNRLEAIHKSGAAHVAAISDPAPGTAAEAHALAPQARLASSFDQLLALDLDGLVIATPSALHAEQATRALEAGLAVFCQKPLGRNAAETRRVVDAARASNRLLAVDLSYRFITGARRIRELVRDRQLGRVYAANLVFHNAYGPDKAWFYDPKLSGGGCLIDLGSHLIDLALWTLDYPEVTGVSSRLLAKGEPVSDSLTQVEDYAAAQLDLRGGLPTTTAVVVGLTCSWKLQAGCDSVIEAAFYGTEGGAALRNVNGSFYDFMTERFSGTRREALTSPEDSGWEWGGRAIVDWATRLAAGQRFDEEAERLVETAAALDRIYNR